MDTAPPAALAPRPATVEDAPAIAALVNGVAEGEIGVPWTDAGQVIDDLTSTTRVPDLDGSGVYEWLLRHGERAVLRHRPSAVPVRLSVGRFLGNERAVSLFASLA